MLKIINKSNWLTAVMIFLMPVLLVFFLGSQLAYSQAKSKFESYQNIPEVTRLAELEASPDGQIVMVRGRISEATPKHHLVQQDPNLIIYQERPADGREVRYREEFNLIFPEFVMDLTGGTITIVPSQTHERVIQHELHRILDGDYEYTGFRIGDTVTVQGQWQPQTGIAPTLNDVTGITSADKQRFMSDWQDAFQKVSWARNGLGLLTLAGIILLAVQIRRTKSRTKPEEADSWQSQETKTTQTVSP